MGTRLSVGAALAGLVVAAVAAILLPRPPGPLQGADAARAFMEAWERQRTATFVVESLFTRTVADGRVLEDAMRVAQRPPDRLEVGLGSVQGRVDSERIDCSTAPGEALRCFSGQPVADYDTEVALELERLRPYVLGSRPLYRIAADGRGCFTLALALDHPSPPYGRAAEFCFDESSGAPVRTVIRRPEAVDRTVATEVRTTVDDRDFVVPDYAGELPG